MTDRPFTLLFVCSGNTCRSPLAQELARREAVRRGWEGRIRILSAGTGAYPGSPASEGSSVVASRHGLDLSDHRSSPLTPEGAGEADLILGMSHGHVARAAAVAPEAQVALLGSYAEGVESLDGPEVPDPFGAPVEVYEETFRVMEELVGRVMDRLAEELDAR